MSGPTDAAIDVASRFLENLESVIRGKHEEIKLVLSALACKGHVLFEDVPGTAKTVLARAIARSIEGAKHARIQCTPDLQPTDVTGLSVYNQHTRDFEFRAGPIFANTVLVDEINRAMPKTQSALLEAMQEQTVTIAGVEYKLQLPFLVLATQNPLEMDGTYPLPEAQLDRFFLKLQVTYPSFEDLSEIVDRTTQRQERLLEPILQEAKILEAQQFVRDVPIASHIKNYAIRIVMATHPQIPVASEQVKRYVRYGSSPRGVQSLVLAGKVHALFQGRFHVSFEDIRAVATACLRHRLILNFEGEAEGVDSADLIRDILEHLPEQAPR